MAIPETSLVAQQGGIAQFEGTVQDMALKLNEMKAKIALVNQFFRDIMEKDTDYGIIPGTPKPSLYQPGADKLCSLYNLAKMIVCKDENKNFETGHYDVTVRVQLVHRGSNIVVGELEGSCSTMESKYRYRWVGERDVPRGIDKETLQYKEYDGQYGPYKKYRIENDDLYSQWNTVLKMAIKRAYVGCTLSSTGLSGLFTQGEEELEDWINGDDTSGENERKRQTGGQQRQPRQQPQGQQRQSGGGTARPVSEPQKKAIFAISKGKQLNSDEVKALAVLRTGKELTELTSQEASGMIDYLNTSTTDDLFQALDQSRNDESFDGGA